LLATLALGGCFPPLTYRTMDQLTPEQRARVASLDGYYLGKAREQAAFTLNCPATGLTLSVVSTRPTKVWMANPDGHELIIEDAPGAAAVGAEGCGQRTTYHVLCGPHQNYENRRAPCDVVPSNEAANVVHKNSQDQARIDDEAAAAAAAQQQQQQQHAK
jgi:hypothetical protein